MDLGAAVFLNDENAQEALVLADPARSERRRDVGPGSAHGAVLPSMHGDAGRQAESVVDGNLKETLWTARETGYS